MSGTHRSGGAGDPGRDLRDLDGVREPGAEMIVFRRDEHLTLTREPAPRPRVLDPIEIALEAQPKRIGRLGACSLPCAHGTRRAGRERRVELGLALLAALHAPPDERVRASCACRVSCRSIVTVQGY